MGLIAKISQFANRRAGWVVFILSAIYFLLLSFFCLVKYYNFGYNALDLAIINQVFYNSSLGRFFAASIHPPTYLGDHFSPIIFLFLPLYRLWPQPPALLILQTLTLAACAWPLYYLTRMLANKTWALLAVVVWLANPFVQNINLFEFSFLPFAVFFIFWACYFYQKQNFWAMLGFCLLALLVREDAALVIFGLGLLGVLEKKKWRFWLWPLVLSAVYFVLAVKLSGAYSLSGQYKFLLYYSWLGDSIFDIAKNVLLHPWLILFKIFSPGSWIVFAGLLLPLVFTPLLKPKPLILAAPVYLQLATGTAWQGLAIILYTQYCSLLLPGIFLAAIYSLPHWKNFQPPGRAMKFIWGEKNLLKIVATVTVVYALVCFGPLPALAGKIRTDGLIWPQTPAMRELLALIPPDAPVAASYDFLTPLSSRASLASLNYVFLGKQQFLYADYALPPQTEYLAVNYTDLIAYQLQYGLNAKFSALYESGRQNWPQKINGFGLIYLNEGLALYQKAAAPKFLPVQILTALPKISQAAELQMTDDLIFLGANMTPSGCQLFWQANLPLAGDYFIRFNFWKDGKLVAEKIYPFAYGALADPALNGQKIIQTDYGFGGWRPELWDVIKSNLQHAEIGGIELNGWRGTENVIKKETGIGPEITLSKNAI